MYSTDSNSNHKIHIIEIFIQINQLNKTYTEEDISLTIIVSWPKSNRLFDTPHAKKQILHNQSRQVQKWQLR